MATITEGDSKLLEAEIQHEMDKVLKFLDHDLLSIRSGKACSAMVEDLPVDCYGAIQKMKGVASISTPDARLIIIQPWDKSLNGEIFKSIQNSNLGVTPVIDGAVIRIQLPVMSSERREELIKVLKKKIEETKVKIRNLRRDYISIVKDNEKKGTLSEDFSKRTCDLLQKITDAYIEKTDAVSNKKETELKLV